MPRKPARVPCKENCGEFARYNKISNSNEALCSKCERIKKGEKVRVQKLKAIEKRRTTENHFKELNKLLEIKKFENETMELEMVTLELEEKLEQTENISKKHREELESMYQKDMDV